MAMKSSVINNKEKTISMKVSMKVLIQVQRNEVQAQPKRL